MILMRQIYGCDKDRQSDINEAKIRVEENNEEVKRQGEDCFDKENKNMITTRRIKVIFKRQSD